MAWYDDLAYTELAIASGVVGSRIGVSRPRPISWGAPFRVSPESRIRWSTISPRPRARSAEPRPGFPERIQIELPPVRPEPRPPIPATPGDLLGSIGATFADLGRNVDLANLIPWVMERPKVVADAISPVLGAPLDVFLGVLEQLSNVAGPILDWLPKTGRETLVRERLRAARALAGGQELELAPLLMGGVTGVKAAEYLWSVMAARAGQEDVSPIQKRAELFASIDLPDAVKESIRRRPDLTDAELDALVEPHGYQWSYRNPLMNLAYDFLVYGAEAIGLGRLAMGLGPAGAAIGGTAGRALALGGQAVTRAAAIQKYYFAAGLGTSGLLATLETIARFRGDEEAVRWWEEINKAGPFAENPNVQLTTAFATNPFAAANALRRGVVSLAHGLGDVTVGRALGKRMLLVHDSDELLYGMFGRIFGQPDAGAARLWAEAHNWDRGKVFNYVMNIALDTAINRYSPEKRKVIAAMLKGLSREEYARTVLRRFGKEALDLIEREPGAVAARAREHAWHYHRYQGRFDPELALANATDYMAAVEKYGELAASLDAVVGYTELLQPKAANLARQLADEWTGPDGALPLSGMNGLDDLLRRFPALRRNAAAVVTPEMLQADRVPRAVVEDIIKEAERQYAEAARINPVKAATGRDPVLRPDSPDPDGDLAVALGTERETISSLYAVDLSADAIERYRILHRQLTGYDLPAELGPEDVWRQIGTLVDKISAPWREAGRRVARIDSLAKVYRARAHELLAKYGGKRSAMPRDVRQEFDLMVAREDVANQLMSELDPSWIGRRVGTVASRRAGRKALATLEEQLAAEERYRRLADIWEQIEALDQEVQAISSEVVGEFAWVNWFHRIPDSGELGRRGAITFPVQIRRSLKRWLERRGLGALAASVDDMGDQDLLRALQTDERYKNWVMSLPQSSPWRQAILSNRPFLKKDLADVIDRGLPSDEAASPRAFRGPAPDQQWEERMKEILDSYEALIDEAADIIESLTGRRRPRSLFRDPMRIQAVLQRPPDIPEWVWETSIGHWKTWEDIAAHGAHVPDDPLFAETVRESFLRAFYRWARDPQPHNEPTYMMEYISADPVLRQAVLGANADRVRQMLARPGRTSTALEEFEVEQIIRDTLGTPEHALEIFRPLIEKESIDVASDIDAALLAGDEAAIAELRAAAELRRVPPVRVPRSLAAESGRLRPSTVFVRRYQAVGGSLHGPLPDEALTGVDGLGLSALSLLVSGRSNGVPQTVYSVVRGLQMIERGEAKRLGLGQAVTARAQLAAYQILDNTLKAQKRTGIQRGVLSAGLDPAMLDEEDLALARELLSDENAGLLIFDPELGPTSLQYGLKRRPKASILTQMQAVPGLVEEFMLTQWQPWSERIWTAQLRRIWNYLMGPLRNTEIGAQARAEFIDRLARRGIGAEISSAIWERWIQAAKESRPTAVIVDPKTGVRQHIPGEHPLYASARNIPTLELDKLARQAIADLASQGVRIPSHAFTIHYGQVFREATSLIRRTLADRGPLGRALAEAYGLVVHNKAVTTLYYWFRFGLDIRFHAMDYLEGPFLFLGRAGAMPERLRRGLLGWTEERLRNIAVDALGDTGYPFSRSRMAWAYKAFRREQLPALEAAVKDIERRHPGIMRRVILDIAEHDPELAATIRAMGDTPEDYLRALDAWHGKLLNAVDTDDAIAEAIADVVRANPELEEVMVRLETVNRQLWDDIRATFYGSAERSRVERFLNSYLLFWPLSYQVKATKWLLRLMFERMGGVPTNAAGAYIYGELARRHADMVANDPQYAAWLERHKTLLFVAQMLFPITPASIGVTLNPALRSLFFGRRKAVWDIGPIYTFTELLPDVAREVYVDLYPAMRDVPGFEGVYRALTGERPPAMRSTPAQEEVPQLPTGVPG